MVGKVRLVSVMPQFSFFFGFVCFLGIAKNCLYLHIVNSLASSLFFKYKPR